MNKKERLAIESFIANFETMVNILERNSSYLHMNDDVKENRDEAIKILRKKTKKMVTAESKKDLKEVLKVNKLLEQSGVRDE